MALVNEDKAMIAKYRCMPCGLTLVWPGLWVGSAQSITTQFLETQDVRVLVWATPEVTLPVIPESIRVIEVLVKDEPNVDLSSFFPTVMAALKECKGKGMVFVCRAGVSRSATLALASLVGDTDLPQMTLKYAYEMVKVARPFIRPNIGFFAQLIAYEKKVRSTSTVALVPSPYDAAEMIPDIYLEEINMKLSPTFNTFIPL